MEFIAVFVLGFWAGLSFCRYGVTLIALDYPASKALALFRRELRSTSHNSEPDQ